MGVGHRRLGILIAALLAAGCGSTQATPAPTPSPTATPAPTPLTEPADTIFHNGALITMEKDRPQAEAIAVRNGLIQAVGSEEEVMALRGPSTGLVDLAGRTLMPGFIDGHTHMLRRAGDHGKSLEEAQRVAIGYGFTGITEMWADQALLDTLLSAERAGRLDLRVSVFASYNDGIRDANHRTPILRTWMDSHAPILDWDRHLRIPGVKVFVDGDHWTPIRGCWAFRDPLPPKAPTLAKGLCATNRGDLYWTQDQLNRIVAEAQAKGFRVAFHAMGDGAIEASLDAIEFALAGRSNDGYRHQIEHNSLAAPDQLPRYKSMGVVGSVRGYMDLCDLKGGFEAEFGSERYKWYVDRFALPGLTHAYVETDFGWQVDPADRFAQRTLDPIAQLYGLVTHKLVNPDGSTCGPDPLVPAPQVTVQRALEMLTIEPAYAVSMEEHVGSLKAGKLADLIVLSGNPLTVAPDGLKDLAVQMTMIGGKPEYCAAGAESLCVIGSSSSTHSPTPKASLRVSGDLAHGQTVTASRALAGNAPELAVDGNEATHWGAGAFAPQWIEVDLGAPAQISEIRLLASQTPAGRTRHRLLVRTEGGELTLVHQFDQATADRDWLVFKPAQPLAAVRAIRIETVSSPSWVSWFEIQALGKR